MFQQSKIFIRNKENISLLDLAPTIAKLMGLPTVREWEGKSVMN